MRIFELDDGDSNGANNPNDANDSKLVLSTWYDNQIEYLKTVEIASDQANNPFQ